MGNAAEKLDALTPETADPAVVVDLAEYKHRRSLSACRLASGRSHLGYESASEHGLYRYTAFGKTVEDTTTITQPLRWKGRWFSSVAGGIYDVRARQWSPEMGVFLAVDDFEMHSPKTTLWGWPNQSPVRLRDPSGRGVGLYVECVLQLTKGHPDNFPMAAAICLPFLRVPDPPAEFPSCAKAPAFSGAREICCALTCQYDQISGHSTRKPQLGTPTCPPYRDPLEDDRAVSCFYRCLGEPMSFGP